MLLEPKEFTCDDQNGKQRTYILSKFDCVGGREIIAKYPVGNLPKLGEYAVSEETMFKLMAYVAVDNGGTPLQLTIPSLVKNHVPDWETLLKIERAMLAYNCSFFQDGKGLTSLAELTQKALAWASKISMVSLVELLQAVKQHSTNSEPSTRSKMDS